MSQGLGMSLDDYIKVSKPSRGGGGGGSYSRFKKSDRGGYQSFGKPRFRQSGGYRNSRPQADEEEYEGGNNNNSNNGAFNKVFKSFYYERKSFGVETQLGT